MTVFTLDMKGIVGAIAIGIALLIFGGSIGWLLVTLMVYFLVLSYAVTLVRLDYKEKRALTERHRGIANVAANGLVPVVFALALYLGGIFSNNVLEFIGLVGFIGAVAGVTADKFASELGVLDGVPYEILTLRPVKKGKSGAVTLFGFVVSAIAAAFVAMWIFPISTSAPWLIGSFDVVPLVLIVTAAGFFGSVIDSVAGYFEEKGIGNKHTSNLICSVAAGSLAVVMALLLI